MIKKLQMVSVLLLSSFLQASDNNQPASPQTRVPAVAPAIKAARAASIVRDPRVDQNSCQRNLFPDIDSATSDGSTSSSAGSTCPLINRFGAMSVKEEQR